MSDSIPPPLQPPSPAPRKRRHWLRWGCGGVLAILLIVVAIVAITIWRIQRPIKPVVLSEKEKVVVEAKLQKMRGETDAQRPSNATQTTKPSSAPSRYVPGGKELRLTERELNGLLNQNTDLGKRVRLELETDAINAYVAVPIPKDAPMFGGKTLRARGRFKLSVAKGEPPMAMLEDVTVMGLSLPKEWLGGVKGKNLLSDAVGDGNGSNTWKGIKSLRVVPGAIVLEVGD